MVKKNNPILISSIFFAIFVYLKILPINVYKITNSVIPPDKIQLLSGRISSNPKKISQNYYLADFKIDFCQNKELVKSKTQGLVSVLIPSSIVESFFPNKLFSKNKNSKKIDQPLEKGAIVISKVKYFKNKDDSISFIFTDIEKVYYDETFFGKIQKIRAYSRINFRKIIHNWGRAGGLFLALISSSTDNLESDFKELFRNSGLSHILALSGMHLSLISSLGIMLKNNMKKKKLATIFQCLLILLFVWFAGLSPSLLRALISFSLMTMCSLFDIKPMNQLYVLPSVFLIHCIISPKDLFNIGFILSYGALAGILILSPFFNSITSKFLPEKISLAFSSSLGAIFFTSPVSFYYFGFVSPGGIICTMFASPMITFFLYSGILLFFISIFIPFFEFISSFCMNGIYKIIYESVKIFDFIPQINLN